MDYTPVVTELQLGGRVPEQVFEVKQRGVEVRQIRHTTRYVT